MNKTSVPSFPELHSDELLISIVARYHLLSGNRSGFETLRQLFLARSVVTFTGLPSRLTTLFEQLPSGWIDSSIDLIHRTTLFPYFRPFLSQDQAENTIRLMLGQCGMAIKVGIGLSASRIGAVDIPRYCPECANHDILESGTPYWHRSHILPGVLVCSQHNVQLREIIFPPHLPSRHALFLPPCDDILENEYVSPCYTKSQFKILSQIAQNSQKLLQLCLEPISKEDILAAYKDRLNDMGILTSNGSVRQSMLHEVITSYYAEISGISPFAELFSISNREHCWIASLLRNRKTSTHPLKHLLIITALYDSLDEFLGHISVGPQKAYHAVNAVRSDSTIDILMLERLIVIERLTLTQVSSYLGVDVTTISVEAEKHHIPLRRNRPTRHHPKTVLNAKQLLRKGISLAEISLSTHLSISSLNRILRANSSLCYHRNKSLFRRERRHRRLMLTEIVLTNPDATRSEIRRNALGTWTWLYRHDMDWLNSMLPEAKSTMQFFRNNIDWGLRDSEAALAVRDNAEKLLTQKGAPVRLSKAILTRTAEVCHLIKNDMSKMPKTQKCLEQFSETIEDFQVRRVNYVSEILMNANIQLYRWRIKKLAGLPKAITNKVQQELNAKSQYNP